MKRRLDELLVQRQLAADIVTARGMIGAGEVLVNERCADKAGELFAVDCPLRVKHKIRYVSRGGLKLEKALSDFHLDPTGMVCVDIGASSGGFTDCLLQHGARRVYAVDVAYGQLDWKIRTDQRVVVIERLNARKLTPSHIGEAVQLAVMDTSFISITRIIPSLLPLFAEAIQIIALIKPQFELPKDKIGPGGVVRDEALHNEAIAGIIDFADRIGLHHHQPVPSPILGPKGNTEFLILLHR